jgi:glycosyltransferase involved in cell wall biosynthesis
MKILIDATSTQDQFASRGIGKFTHEVVSRMIKESKEQNRDDIFYLLTFNAPTSLEHTINENPEIVRTINIGKLRYSDKFNFVWWRTQYLPQIKKIIEEDSPDIYFCPYFWRHAPYKHIPTFTAIHDLAFPILGRYSTAPKYLDWIRKFQYHRALNKVKRAAGVITNSKNTKKDLLKYVDMKPSKVHTVYLGIDENIREVEPDNEILMKYLPLDVIERGYILYYGGVEPNKNVKQLVLSYKRFKTLWEKRGIDMEKLPYLVLAGGDFTKLDMSNNVLADIRYCIDEENLRDYVYFTGYFEDEHINDLLSGSYLFMHLSKYEGFGLAALEAMKTGRPVIASDRSCYGEILSSGAELVDPANEKAVAEEMFEILTDEEKYIELSEKARERAEYFSWDKTADDVYQIFKNYLDEKGKDTEKAEKKVTEKVAKKGQNEDER